MTYNVFGGTLNLAQFNSCLFCCYDLAPVKLNSTAICHRQWAGRGNQKADWHHALCPPPPAKSDSSRL